MHVITQRLAANFGAVTLHVLIVATAAANAILADAVENRDSDVIRAEFAKKADVNARQADGMTALHWAVLHDEVDLVKRLITAGAQTNAANRYGITPLLLACTNGNTAIVNELLAAGADPNSTRPGGATALMIAARTGRRGPVQALLARGADINARERNQQTALMWAAAEGNVEVVDVLIENGADFRTPLASGLTPLFFAVREGRGEVVSRLIQAGADINEILKPQPGEHADDKQSTTALILAVENGHFELATALLDAGADPNAHPAGYTALHAITWVRKPIRGDGNPSPIGSGNLSSLDFVRRLVSHGADVNARLENGVKGRGRFTTTGSTPFLLAARASDVSLMRLLLKMEANPETPNADNCTPLLAAAGVGALENGEESAGTEEEAIETVRVLLDQGADLNTVDNNGETAMHGAAYQNRPKLVQLLDERGADIGVWNRKNNAGWTPLMIAQGHRPGNFRPAPDTIAALERVMRKAGVVPPKGTSVNTQRDY
jgi:ankyrin repeat protein